MSRANVYDPALEKAGVSRCEYVRDLKDTSDKQIRKAFQYVLRAQS